MSAPIRKRKAEADPPRRPRNQKRPAYTPGRKQMIPRPMTDAQLRQMSNARTGGYLGQELKYMDTNVTAGSIVNNTWVNACVDPTGAGVLCQNGIGQGDGAQNRDGRAYAIKSVHVKGWISIDPIKAQTTQLSDTLIRLVLVLDKQTNGAQMDPQQLFNGAAGFALSGFRNLEYVQRFRVIEDITFRIENPGPAEAVNSFGAPARLVPFQMNKDFKTPIKVTCSGAAGTVAAITDNSLHLVCCQVSDVLVAPVVKMNYWTRVRFIG